MPRPLPGGTKQYRSNNLRRTISCYCNLLPIWIFTALQSVKTEKNVPIQLTDFIWYKVICNLWLHLIFYLHYLSESCLLLLVTVHDCTASVLLLSSPLHSLFSPHFFYHSFIDSSIHSFIHSIPPPILYPTLSFPPTPLLPCFLIYGSSLIRLPFRLPPKQNSSCVTHYSNVQIVILIRQVGVLASRAIEVNKARTK